MHVCVCTWVWVERLIMYAYQFIHRVKHFSTSNKVELCGLAWIQVYLLKPKQLLLRSSWYLKHREEKQLRNCWKITYIVSNVCADIAPYLRASVYIRIQQQSTLTGTQIPHLCTQPLNTPLGASWCFHGTHQLTSEEMKASADTPPPVFPVLVTFTL